MEKDNKIYLKDIEKAIFKIENYIRDVNFATFEQEEMRQDAVIRQLEIVGEAVNRLSSQFKTDTQVSRRKRLLA